MEEQASDQVSQGSDSNTPPPPPPPDQRSEPVRSRWTPKPEQILILESIFNSGMVNPPKDETVRIRKLLEKFGSVGDANVFYWFQNRRSRSRRRQRQLQAQAQQASYTAAAASAGGAIHQFPDNGYTVPPAGFGSAAASPPSFLLGPGSSCGGGDQSLLAVPPSLQQMGVHAQIGQSSSSMFWPSNGSQNLQFVESGN